MGKSINNENQIDYRSSSKSPFRLLMHRMLKAPGQLTAIIIFAVLSNILILLGPKLIGQAIDLLVANQGAITEQFTSLTLVLISVYILASTLNWLLGLLTTRISAKIIADLRTDIYNHIDKLPLSYFDSVKYGSLSSLISTDIDQVNDGLINGLPQLFSGLVSLVGSIYFMFSVSWQVTLLILFLTPIIMLVSRTISRSSYKMYSLEAEQRGILNGLAEETIAGHTLVRTLQADRQFIEQYRELNQELYRYGQKAQFYSSLTNPSTRLINATSYILCGALASYLALKGELTVGQVGSLLFYANQFSKPINEITEIITQLQAALASTSKIFEVLSIEPVPSEPTDMAELKVDQGEIKFDQVSFSYDKNKPLIENLNVTIPGRSKIAIVGPTGAGKTTLVNLLMRFYDLDAGNILIDGQDITQVTRQSVRRNFGMVLQDVWLFKGTIMENLSFANPRATRAEIEAVCKSIEADQFIRRLQHGYETIIGEDHVLSQGQQQLLTVARVMLQNPPMLILDEATSDIDTMTEMRVQKAFHKLMKGRTSFVIAHRLSTILDADLILVMQDGNIVEQGNFTSLMQTDSLFRNLYESQFSV
ncbi:MAG TPA: ABC transporter ATP-binding protein [Clostridiaceae bacterium]|nr:ABC transporter ATP-binding protein [Clostridiaceae bacterium]